MLLLLLTIPAASASQTLTGKPDETLAASVSRAEPTLVRVDGQRIRRVFGAEGDFMVTPDPDTGAAYIKPTTDKAAFTAFVTDDAGRTWKLLLASTDGVSDSIVIKAARGSGDPKAEGRDFARNQSIKRAILQIDSNDDDSGARNVNEVVPLWDESIFVLTRVIEGPFRGEKYRLTNVSAKPMIIDEREIYRRGVVAISIERPTLNPGESTSVIVISEGGH